MTPSYTDDPVAKEDTTSQFVAGRDRSEGLFVVKEEIPDSPPTFYLRSHGALGPFEELYEHRSLFAILADSDFVREHGTE